MSRRGELVWGKLLHYPWWPAIIIYPEDCGRDRIRNNKHWLFWFGDHKITQVDPEKILDFKEYFVEKYDKKNGKLLKAIKEILIVCAEHCQVDYTDSSSLFQWATNGFKLPSSPPLNRMLVLNELPDVVLKALQNENFQRKEKSDSESEDEIDQVIDDVRKGLMSLEDICIICCKVESRIVMQHPLFIGGVCQKCKTYVNRINKTKFGEMQDICVVCGDGGNLVYCSRNLCLRSYCKLCIECMVNKRSYSKITKNDNWKCYLCVPDSGKHCQIRRRDKYKSKIISTPTVPKETFPISVVAHNDTVLKILKEKGLVIKMYSSESDIVLESSNRKTKYHYVDFSQEELHKIRPDLICGAFVSCTPLQNETNNCIEFSSAFFKFLFRLDNAKTLKPTIFFIFVSIAGVLNSEVLSRVLRFVRVNPVSVQVNDNKFVVWTNIPNFSYTKKGKPIIFKTQENKSAEEEIFSKFMDPLKYYFKEMD